MIMKLYAELAHWFHLLTHPDDYADEAAFVQHLLTEAGVPTRGTLLELGAGGGNNAVHLKAHFTLTLTDIAPDILALSRTLNPECEHIVGDMRSLRLGRTFDAVFVHDAVMYMTTEADLRAAIETTFIHCRPGGVTVFVPDCVTETFEPTTEHGGHDGDGRSLRYLEWCYDPDPTDTTTLTHYVYLLRDGDTPVQCEHETSLEGLFSRADWLRLFSEVGFQPRVVRDDYGRDVFVGIRTPTLGEDL